MNSKRRLFIKKAGIKSTAALAGAMLLATPKKADAIALDVPAAVISLYEKLEYWYNEYAKEWYDKIKELGEAFGGDSPIVPTALYMGDAANHVRRQTENMRRRREAEIPPSENCLGGMSNVGSEIAAALSTVMGEERGQRNRSDLQDMYSDTYNYQVKMEREINEELEAMSLAEILESVDGSRFAGNRGYLEPEQMKMFMLALLSRSRVANSRAMNRSTQGIAAAGSTMSRISVSEDALQRIYNRRLPNKQLYRDAATGGRPYEADILKRLERDGKGLSAVDFEQFEIDRTHLSKAWQDSIEDLASFTALSKELNTILAAENMIDEKILEFIELENVLKSVSAIMEQDSVNTVQQRNRRYRMRHHESDELLGI